MKSESFNDILRLGAGIALGVGLYHFMTKEPNESLGSHVERNLEDIKEIIDIPIEAVKKAAKLDTKKKKTSKKKIRELKTFRLLGSSGNNPVTIKAHSRTEAHKKYGKSYGNQSSADWVEDNKSESSKKKNNYKSNQFKISECKDINRLKKELSATLQFQKKHNATDISGKIPSLKRKIAELKKAKNIRKVVTNKGYISANKISKKDNEGIEKSYKRYSEQYALYPANMEKPKRSEWDKLLK